MKVLQNISRLQHLLKLYKISVPEFLTIISDELKNPLTETDVFSKNIEISHLKRIDKIFNRGLSYYLNPENPIETKEASIFFRKENFNSQLNLATTKIVNEYEGLKLSLFTISKLSGINIERSLPILTLNDSPRNAAIAMGDAIYPTFIESPKKFLIALINKLATRNVFVFEFIEAWNKTEKVNVDGFFLQPNFIVLKRQKSYRREIFTLLHEFGHYLLNIEEIDKLKSTDLANRKLDKVEKWCNNFAFHFLIRRSEEKYKKLPVADSSNDYNHKAINEISKNTHLSKVALFTRLLYDKKIAYLIYVNTRKMLEERSKAYYERMVRERELQRELAKKEGKKIGGFAPKPITSDLLVSTVQRAFYEGVIDEYQVCKTLKISPKTIDNYIQ